MWWQKIKGKRRITLLLLLVVLAVPLVYFAVNRYLETRYTLRVAFIDVGRGDAMLISDSRGFDVLIDGGERDADTIILSYLREQGVEDVDVLVATHSDMDHLGGLIGFLKARRIPVKSVLYNGYHVEKPSWQGFIDAVHRRGLELTPAQYPQTFTWGEATAYILNPEAGLPTPMVDEKAINDASLVILLDYKNVEFLFTADATALTESELMAKRLSLKADILKAGHHGDGLGSTAEFLSLVKPAEAIISVGPNVQGLPSPETLNRLIEAGARVWRTDKSGTIVVETDGWRYKIYAEE
ncbi:MAG: MBL fold metallo-hydrolase [Anaerolineales bacterium]|jgi:beta-lactamase superfamily II metal-dependent hydrolase